MNKARDPVRAFILVVLTAYGLPAHCADAGYAARATDLLESPATPAKVVVQLAKRQPVQIIGRDGSWAKAQAGTATEWVRLADLRLNPVALPNAFAVPGGYVFTTQGMIALAGTESELAGILGHEISHVVRKHHLRWIYMNKDLEVSVRRAEEQIGKTSAASRQIFQQMGMMMQSSIERIKSPEVRSGLSKSEEFEADSDGAILAWRAGYEAWGLVAALQRFEAASRNLYAAETALAGHPEPLQRLKMLDTALRSRSERDTLGELGTERFQGATQSLRQRSG